MKRRKIYLFTLLIISASLFITSCSKDDDNNKIDEEWKTLNETRFNEVATNSEYNKLVSETNAGSVYWQKTTFINDEDNTSRITSIGTPEFTDTVVVRYEGWYFDKLGEKKIFDSTENPSIKSNIAFQSGILLTQYPNSQPLTFAVAGTTASTITQAPIATCSGALTLLQDMKVGEQRVVCIPQQLGFGSSGNYYTPVTNGSSYLLIPGYTTLWFNIKLVKIIPMSGLSS